ncbi:MAG: glycosyltransferase family 4 protein [Saprospiraceae bacterium]|nr:glycosyltransferase family 4 protein [Lewinella sp.]
MRSKTDRKIVILNQAVNYLTIGFANAFNTRFDEVVLITGSVHTQGEVLDDDIQVEWIRRWQERPALNKLLSYLSALVQMWWLLLFKYRRHEVFFVSVPPMGYLLNLLLPHRFSAVIWDVFPDAFKITGMSERHLLYRIWARLNRRSFRRMYRLFTISDYMADLMSRYVDRKSLIVQPIWSIFQANERVSKNENPFVQEHALADKFIVQYSGNIGLSHKVELMVELAKILRDHNNILFQIIGRGPRKPTLERLVVQERLPNCTFLPFQPDEMFPYSLSAADLGVVILDEEVSKGSVPSKSYNLMSYGIPSLYFAAADSQLQAYSDAYGHARCFRAVDLGKAADFILELSQKPNLQKDMAQKAEAASLNFRRENANYFVQQYLNPN